MNSFRARVLLSTLGFVLLATPELRAQMPDEAALAATAAEALEPGVRAALRDGQPVSFESRSDWGRTVKDALEKSLGLSLTAEHRRGAGRIVLADPVLDDDTASVEVWFGRCEAHPHVDAEILRIRMYSFTFRHVDGGWSLLRPSRLGTRQASCDADLLQPDAVQT